MLAVVCMLSTSFCCSCMIFHVCLLLASHTEQPCSLFCGYSLATAESTREGVEETLTCYVYPWQVQRRRQVVGDEAADEAQPQPLFCITIAIGIVRPSNKQNQLTFYRSEYCQKWTFHCNFSGSRVKWTWMFLSSPLLDLISQHQKHNIASGFRLVQIKEEIKLFGYIITRKSRSNRDWTGSNHSNVNAGTRPETNFKRMTFPTNHNHS